MSCLSQITLHWQHFAEVRKASQIECSKLFFSCLPPRFFQTHKILPSFHKNAVPTTQQSLVVYQYGCRCDCRYLGRTPSRLQERITQHIPNDCRYLSRTSLRLHERITQHIPKSIRNKEKPTKVLPRRNRKANTTLNQLECDSAIGLHLLLNPDCAVHYHDRQFSILGKARTQFHLVALEVIFIKTQQPILCRHKEVVYYLQVLQ